MSVPILGRFVPHFASTAGVLPLLLPVLPLLLLLRLLLRPPALMFSSLLLLQLPRLLELPLSLVLSVGEPYPPSSRAAAAWCDGCWYVWLFCSCVARC